MPVAAHHVDEVAEALAAAHGGAGEIPELLAGRDAAFDHLARGVGLTQHATELAQEAERERLRPAVATHRFQDLETLGESDGG